MTEFVDAVFAYLVPLAPLFAILAIIGAFALIDRIERP